MNRKETAERIKIMQAFVDGKLIEFKDCMGCWCVAVNPSWNWDSGGEYRIKPEPKYRPFANAEECWQEMQKHQPFGWIKASHGKFPIIGFKNNMIAFGRNDNWQDYNYIFKSYTFADGTPFGIKEE